MHLSWQPISPLRISEERRDWVDVVSPTTAQWSKLEIPAHWPQTQSFVGSLQPKEKTTNWLVSRNQLSYIHFSFSTFSILIFCLVLSLFNSALEFQKLGISMAVLIFGEKWWIHKRLLDLKALDILKWLYILIDIILNFEQRRSKSSIPWPVKQRK